MRSKSVVLLILALGCGLVASIGISQVMERRNAPVAPVGEMEPIFIAADNINYNEPITPEKLKLQEWPKDKIPAGAITKLEDLQGQRAGTKLFAGEPILAGKLMGADGMAGAADKIPPGYRLIAVKVDAVTGASSLILPNDRVDVLVHLQKNETMGVKETCTRTILQDVRVFSVNEQFERKGKDESTIAAKTVGLMVTPQQAAKITLATEIASATSGSIRLILRSPDDGADSNTHPISVQDLLGETDKNERDAEDEAAKQAKKELVDTEPAKPVVEQPAMPLATSNHGWKMMLVVGSEVREVELSGTGEFPEVVGTKAEFNPPESPSEPAAQPPQDAQPDDSDGPDTGTGPTEDS